MNLITHNAIRLGMTPAEALEGGFLDLQGAVLPAHPTTSEGATTVSEQIAPVTPNLAAALDRAGLALRTIEQSGKKLNDADAFKSLAHQLEDLTVSTLQASSSLSLIGVEPAGARFNMAPDTELARHVAESVAYLRGPATNLLKGDGSFSRYESTHAADVLDRLKGLYGLLLNSIKRRAYADLTAASDRSASVLIALAATVAEAADGGRVNTTPKPAKTTR